MFIVKKVENQIIPQTQVIKEIDELYDFFEIRTEEDINGNKVEIPHLIERISKKNLEDQKMSIDSKLEAINNLNK